MSTISAGTEPTLLLISGVAAISSGVRLFLLFCKPETTAVLTVTVSHVSSFDNCIAR